MADDTPEKLNPSGNSMDSRFSKLDSIQIETASSEYLMVGRTRPTGTTETLIDIQKIAPTSPENMPIYAEDTPASGENRFNIKLNTFEGPLELLLHLLREHKIDIYDIPIAFITEQYLKHIEMMKLLNINIASEYLVMSSWLIYVKSRTLLPQQEGEENPEEDLAALKLELQRQLLEYQKFKSLGNAFRQAEDLQSGIFQRCGNGDGIIIDPQEVENSPPLEVTVFDLIAAIQKMIEEAGESGIHLVEVDELEVADRQTHILDILNQAGTHGIDLQKLFEGTGPRRLLLVVTFLAILELVRLNLILATQTSIFGEIKIYKAVNDDG